MPQLLIGFHLIATAIFVLGSAIVGARLVWLAARTRQAPELLLGGAILGTAVFGYGLLIASAIGRGMQTGEIVPTTLVVLTGVGKISHALGITLFLAFVVTVFRPTERWAKALAGSALALMWFGVGWGALEGSFREDTTMTPAWWCEYAVIWTYSPWLVFEATRYWTIMRKRTAIGLADPLVTNRFLLWGTGSLFTFLATMIASTPIFLIDRPELLSAVMPSVYVATAITGIVSISCSYLAFLPPAWFAQRVRGAKPAEEVT